MKQIQEEHLCRDIHKTALALEKIAKALSSAESEARATDHSDREDRKHD